MDIEKFPLAQRIQRCRDGCAAYPEYIPSIIRSFGEMPLAEYLAGIDPKLHRRLSELLGCVDFGDRRYQWAALRICELNAKNPAGAIAAMRILAAPMVRYDDQLGGQEAMTRG